MNKRIANVVEAIKNNDQPIDGLLVVRNERIDCGNARYISGFLWFNSGNCDFTRKTSNSC